MPRNAAPAVLPALDSPAALCVLPCCTCVFCLPFCVSLPLPAHLPHLPAVPRVTASACLPACLPCLHLPPPLRLHRLCRCCVAGYLPQTSWVRCTSLVTGGRSACHTAATSPPACLCRLHLPAVSAVRFYCSLFPFLPAVWVISVMVVLPFHLPAAYLLCLLYRSAAVVCGLPRLAPAFYCVGSLRCHLLPHPFYRLVTACTCLPAAILPFSTLCVSAVAVTVTVRSPDFIFFCLPLPARYLPALVFCSTIPFLRFCTGAPARSGCRCVT